MNEEFTGECWDGHGENKARYTNNSWSRLYKVLMDLSNTHVHGRRCPWRSGDCTWTTLLHSTHILLTTNGHRFVCVCGAFTWNLNIIVCFSRRGVRGCSTRLNALRQFTISRCVCHPLEAAVKVTMLIIRCHRLVVLSTWHPGWCRTHNLRMNVGSYLFWDQCMLLQY